jgi:cytochrome c oxidase cbb3-type subunit 3
MSEGAGLSTGWSSYITILTLGYIAASLWLLLWQRTKRIGKGQPLGHDFDGIQELDNPLPRWWFFLYLGTVVWALLYLIAYPGLGNFRGLLGWTQLDQYEAEMQHARDTYEPIYSALAALPFEERVRDEDALRIGSRLFATNCATCHGSDGRGGSGFPNLTDDDWQYGGDEANIEKSILDGRNAIMPAFAPALGGDDGVREVVAYVRSLSGLPADAALADKGKTRYMQICVACHGIDGKGMQALGSPNLTDDAWLYGGSVAAITEGLYEGRNGRMPAHRHILGPERARILAAYVKSLSGQ